MAGNAAKINACAAFACQTYHSEDNISELHVRIRFRSLQLGTSQEYAQAPLGSAGPTDQSRSAEVEEVAVFRWQEAVASPQDPIPEGAPAYGRPGQCLFSRAQLVGAQSPEEENEEMLTDSLSSACRRLCRCQKRRAAAARSVAGTVLAESIESCERMQLLASLLDAEGPCEVLLCELRAQDGGRFLSVQPPFSNANPGLVAADADSGFPYCFELHGMWYEYTVENASHVPSEAERKRAVEAQQSFDSCAPQMRRNLAGSGFDGLAGADAHYGVIGEIAAFVPRPSSGQCKKNIVESTGDSPWEIEALLRRTTPIPFYTALWRPTFYVVYELSLPVDGEWKVVAPVDSRGILTGIASGLPLCTHYASLSGCWTKNERCIFNHPLELHLAERPRPDPPPDPVPPRLVMQLLRVGSWDRQSLHGYSFVDIPRQPGEYDIEAPLWAPVGTITQQLNAKLCGAYIPLASSHLVAVADMHRRDTLPRNRSALRAQTAVGVLHIQLRVIRHKSAQAPDVTGIGAAIHASRIPRDADGMPLDITSPERLEGLRRRRAARRARRAAEAIEASGSMVTPALQPAYAPGLLP